MDQTNVDLSYKKDPRENASLNEMKYYRRYLLVFVDTIERITLSIFSDISKALVNIITIDLQCSVFILQTLNYQLLLLSKNVELNRFQ